MPLFKKPKQTKQAVVLANLRERYLSGEVLSPEHDVALARELQKTPVSLDDVIAVEGMSDPFLVRTHMRVMKDSSSPAMAVIKGITLGHQLKGRQFGEKSVSPLEIMDKFKEFYEMLEGKRAMPSTIDVTEAALSTPSTIDVTEAIPSTEGLSPVEEETP